MLLTGMSSPVSWQRFHTVKLLLGQGDDALTLFATPPKDCTSFTISMGAGGNELIVDTSKVTDSIAAIYETDITIDSGPYTDDPFQENSAEPLAASSARVELVRFLARSIAT